MFQVPAQLRDPKVLGLAGIAAVAAFALYRRHAAGGSSTSGASGTVSQFGPLDAASITGNILDVVTPQLDTLARGIEGLQPSNPANSVPTPTLRTKPFLSVAEWSKLSKGAQAQFQKYTTPGGAHGYIPVQTPTTPAPTPGPTTLPTNTGGA